MKKKLLLLICLIVISNINAQETPSLEKNQFKINVLLPGIVYEQGLSESNTLYSELSTGFGYRLNNSGSSWLFYPLINEQFRHYYNLDKRAKKGKVTSHNSGGFIAANIIYNFKSISANNGLNSTNSSLTLAPVWGFQRTYKGNFNLGLNAGVGYDIGKSKKQFIAVFNFSLGWVIGK